MNDLDLPEIDGNDELTFDVLRRAGINLAQAFSGHHWTDFNLHDPGVTILEQACYALTELIYRADFDVADLLADSNGQIQNEQLGLSPPDAILPARPLTIADYRRALLDAIDDLDNVQLVLADSTLGLYTILAQPSAEGRRQSLQKEIRQVFHQWRNLCEDIQDVVLMERPPCLLGGRVELHRDHAAEDILAEILARCRQEVDNRIQFHSYDFARQEGLSVDEILDGPLCANGFCRQEDLDRDGRRLTISRLADVINQIDGVDYIHDLYCEIKKDGEDEERRDFIDAGEDKVFDLKIFDENGHCLIKLTSRERQLEIDTVLFSAAWDGWSLRSSAAARLAQNLEKLHESPKGTHRSLERYRSIQNHFPACFGLKSGGSHGSALSSDGTRSARAAHDAYRRQLHAYLLMFDQPMANFASQIKELRNLFANSADDTHTYAHQAIDGSLLHDLNSVYLDDPDKELVNILASFDDVIDRKGRILDRLLGLYGEAFTQNSLTLFDRHLQQPGDRLHKILENRKSFLDQIVELTRDRGGAPNLTGSEFQGGFERRLRVLLNFPMATDHAAADHAAADHHLYVVEHILLRSSKTARQTNSEIDLDFFGFRLSIIFPAWTVRCRDRNFRQLCTETIAINCPAHIFPSLLWLHENDMQRFLALRSQWLESVRDGSEAAHVDGDAAADDLANFLKDHAGRSTSNLRRLSEEHG